MGKQHVGDRVVGKSGGTRSSKAFNSLALDWKVEKSLLKARGYSIEVGPVRDYRQYYLVYFPDGHCQEMLLEEIMTIRVKEAQGR